MPAYLCNPRGSLKQYTLLRNSSGEGQRPPPAHPTNEKRTLTALDITLTLLTKNSPFWWQHLRSSRFCRHQVEYPGPATVAVHQNSYLVLLSLCGFTPGGDWVQPVLDQREHRSQKHCHQLGFKLLLSLLRKVATQATFFLQVSFYRCRRVSSASGNTKGKPVNTTMLHFLQRVAQPKRHQ